MALVRWSEGGRLPAKLVERAEQRQLQIQLETEVVNTAIVASGNVIGTAKCVLGQHPEALPLVQQDIELYQENVKNILRRGYYS